MKLTLLGTGTSQGVPVIGCQCSVCTSSDPRDQRLRCSLLIETDTTRVVVDTGPDFRQQMLCAEVDRLDGVIMTHEHNDHIAGLDDVRSFNFLQQKPMPVFGLYRTLEAVARRFDYIFSGSGYPGLPQVELHGLDDQDEITIGDILIKTFTIMHGNMPVLALRVRDAAYLTDTNHIPDAAREYLYDLDHLILDALHHRKHYSHFTLEQAISEAQHINAQHTTFIHMSHFMGLHAVIDSELPQGVQLGYDGLEIHQ